MSAPEVRGAAGASRVAVLVNRTVIELELRRALRNRRALVLAIAMPALFFLAFGLNGRYADRADGHGNVSASIMISMALYGAVVATTNAGATVSQERAVGWTRQLRLTPLSPAAHVAAKVVSSLVLGLGAVLAVYAVGLVTHRPSLPAHLWILTGLLAWLGSLLFAALGLFLGHLLPPESVTAAASFALALSALCGGLFVPLDQLSPVVQTVAQGTPLYGLGVIVHAPLDGNWPSPVAVLNVAVWLAVLVAGAVWGYRRDSGRT